MNLLNKCKSSGATIIIATHDDSLYRHTSHRIMELCQGKIRRVNEGGQA